MNPAIAKVIQSMSVRDGALAPAITATRSGRDGPEVVKGSSKQEQVHPSAGARPQQSAGQHAVITDSSGGGPRTRPSEREAYGLTQTRERTSPMPGAGNLIQQVMQMMMQSQGGGGAPGPVPQVPGPVTPEMVMQQMGGGGGGLPPEIMAMLGGGGGEMPSGGTEGAPVDDPAGDEMGIREKSTEDELDDVHSEMTKANPEQLVDDLRECIDAGDRRGCMKLLDELDAAGVSTDDLPSDVQQALEKEDYTGEDDGGQYEE